MSLTIGEANAINDQMLQQAMARYKETAPLRARAVSLGQNLQAQRPDLSATFASGNPFQRPIDRSQLPTAPQMPQPALRPAPSAVPMPGAMGPVPGPGGALQAPNRRILS